MPFLGSHLSPAVVNVRVGRSNAVVHRPFQSAEFTGADGVPRDWVISAFSGDGPWPDPQFNLRFRLTDWALDQLPDQQREIARDVDVVFFPVFLPCGSYSAINPGPGLYWLLIDGPEPWFSIRVIDVANVPPTLAPRSRLLTGSPGVADPTPCFSQFRLLSSVVVGQSSAGHIDVPKTQTNIARRSLVGRLKAFLRYACTWRVLWYFTPDCTSGGTACTACRTHGGPTIQHWWAMGIVSATTFPFLNRSP
nr:protein of unknown function [Beauveria bassiana polymycovirus 2]